MITANELPAKYRIVLWNGTMTAEFRQALGGSADSVRFYMGDGTGELLILHAPRETPTYTTVPQGWCIVLGPYHGDRAPSVYGDFEVLSVQQVIDRFGVDPTQPQASTVV